MYNCYANLILILFGRKKRRNERLVSGHLELAINHKKWWNEEKAYLIYFKVFMTVYSLRHRYIECRLRLHGFCWIENERKNGQIRLHRECRWGININITISMIICKQVNKMKTIMSMEIAATTIILPTPWCSIVFE